MARKTRVIDSFWPKAIGNDKFPTDIRRLQAFENIGTRIDNTRLIKSLKIRTARKTRVIDGSKPHLATSRIDFAKDQNTSIFSVSNASFPYW